MDARTAGNSSSCPPTSARSAVRTFASSGDRGPRSLRIRKRVQSRSLSQRSVRSVGDGATTGRRATTGRCRSTATAQPGPTGHLNGRLGGSRIAANPRGSSASRSSRSRPRTMNMKCGEACGHLLHRFEFERRGAAHDARLYALAIYEHDSHMSRASNATALKRARSSSTVLPGSSGTKSSSLRRRPSTRVGPAFAATKTAPR